MREQLQARVTILEGRVRFLEAGFELRPPHQQPLLLTGSCSQGQPQPPLALPAPAGSGAGPGLGLGLGMHAGGSSIGSGSGGGEAYASAPGWGWQAPGAASIAAWRPPQQAIPPRGLQQHARLNPLFDPQQLEMPAVVPGRQHAEARVQPSVPAAGGLGSSGVSHPAAAPAKQQPWLPPPLPLLRPAAPASAPPAVAEQRSYGSAADLISSMQARFSEAEEFLLSLRRL